MAEGGGNNEAGQRSGVDVPMDAEQIAATKGIQTEAQINANRVMEAQIAKKVQAKIDQGIVPAKAEEIQSERDAIIARALAARETDRASKAVTPDKPVVTKKKWWQW